MYFYHQDGISDIYISGMKDRNRAFNGDIVAIMLYPRENWKVITLYGMITNICVKNDYIHIFQ